MKKQEKNQSKEDYELIRSIKLDEREVLIKCPSFMNLVDFKKLSITEVENLFSKLNIKIGISEKKPTGYNELKEENEKREKEIRYLEVKTKL